VQVASSELAARVDRVEISAGATVQTVGARAPSQRMATVPVVAAYLSAFGLMPSACPTSPSVIRAPSRWSRNNSAMRSARWRPFALSRYRPSENRAKSRAATT
jgi:hypothetical protein